MKFFKVKNAVCDFCEKQKEIVTQVDNTYVCADCARKIYWHAQANELICKREKSKE